MPVYALGHSYVGSSFPSEGDVIVEPLEQIELHFDVGIEKHTKIDLIDEAGDIVPLHAQTVEERVLTALLEQPLYKGNYAIHWSALGSDGHATDGTISFTVDAPEPEVIVEKEEEVKELEKESIDEEGQMETEENVQEISGETKEESSTNLKWILFVVFIIVISTIIFARRRK